QGDNNVKDILLVDGTPLSLGIETLGGVNTVLIERNTAIPTSKSQVFSTAADNQPGVEVHVLQGERPMAQDNKSLGKFTLDGIPPAPRGVPQIEVTFEIDSNGILNVKALDKATNKEQHITITGSSNLAEDDIERMKKEAEEHAEEDKKKKGSIETRNKADSLVAQAEKTLKDAGDKVTDEVKGPVQEKIDALKKLLEDKEASTEDLDKSYNELSEEIQKVGAQMYEANASASEASTPDDDGVKVTHKDDDKKDAVEGEVVEEEEKEKEKEDEKKEE
ncbi:Hsp70 family protein, partial [Candidatus Peregrinibacteria bacterium]|nr:Hsp70 family protein [Candidatus Peregrinibacteria bacterium]